MVTGWDRSGVPVTSNGIMYPGKITAIPIPALQSIQRTWARETGSRATAEDRIPKRIANMISTKAIPQEIQLAQMIPVIQLGAKATAEPINSNGRTKSNRSTIRE